MLQEAVSWVESYVASIRDHPVLARVKPGETLERLSANPPRSPEPMSAVLRDLDEIILPAITHWNHPRFFGYFAITGSEPGIAAEMISSALNVNAMLWRTSPAATELEQLVTSWLAQMMGLPRWFGIIHDTASTSTLCALAAARHRANPQVRSLGLARSPHMTVYTSEQAHSSVDKAVLTLGLGTGNLRKIAVDQQFRMLPEALQRAIDSDLEAGLVPAAVVATVGTTATTSVDPIAKIAEVCRRHNVWLHVDAAYAGAAAVLEEFRWIFDGASEADSIVVNPHKWLFVPIDCSVLFMKAPDEVKEAFSIVPDYLRTFEDTPNLMDYGVALGRRFRSLKLWAVIRSMGVDGMAESIKEHIRLCSVLADLVEADPRFEILAPHPFSVLNFRFAQAPHDEADSLNQFIVDHVNDSGRAFVTTTRLNGKLAIHAAIGNLGTTQDDVHALWGAVLEAAEMRG